MIVATAGHIDHGKTTLVRALSGVDTDRLPEEKARGISIDLGFAYWTPAKGDLIGFVDVPGHERFIRNMLAGTCGIDAVMLVVAADDGAMPQTLEHLHIVDLLGISQGVVVVTKADRVSAERAAEVIAQVRSLLSGTSLSDADVVVASAISGQGMAALRDKLAAAARLHQAQRRVGRSFRFAIDRSFSISGSGTVVTGTVCDGEVTVGDHVTITPTGRQVRVRGLQKAGSAARNACAGERCGLNLSGVGVGDVARGDWLVHEAMHSPAQRMDVQLTVLADAIADVKHWTPVHLHLGTAEIPARIATGRGMSIAPGTSAVAKLVLERPIAAANGDRFIIRDQSARTTLGGGVVLDPFSPKRRNERGARIAALQLHEPKQALQQLLNQGGVELDWFRRTFNLTTDHLDVLVRDCGPIVVGKKARLAFMPSAVEAMAERAVECLREFHRLSPAALGVNVEVLRAACAPQLSSATLLAVLSSRALEKKIDIHASLISLRMQHETLNKGDETAWQKLKPALEAAGFKGPTVNELASLVGMTVGMLESVVYRRMRSGDVFRVASGRLYLRSTLSELAVVASATAADSTRGQFTAAQFRDRVGVNRRLAIEILECLDRTGATKRIGDVREMRVDQRTGTARPPAPSTLQFETCG